MKADNTVLPARAAFALRLGVGVVFGLSMAALTHHDVARNTPPTRWEAIAESTLALSAFVWWAGASSMRRLSLAVWGAAITVLVALLAWHQAEQNAGSLNDLIVFFSHSGWLVVPLLFVAHELVSSSDRAHRPIAPYATYFDQAWKHGVQLALALLFTILLWVILLLGAALLGFIGFHWFKDLLLKDWIDLPLTGAAMACGVQLGDVQDKILVNVRALVLSVLSWLLPVITLICLLFLGSLCASGLEPLWKTKAASTTLLGAGVILVLLINAAYQQGDGERPVHVVMKWAARAACLLLPVFAALAAYSLYLRIDQYGLTPERVLAAAGIIIGILFAVGYVAAAAWPGRWLAGLERVNVALAFVEALILLGLLTPIADPARLSVVDQVARLQSGRTALDHFDWNVLRFEETGRYGMSARVNLSSAGKTSAIRTAADNAAFLDVESLPGSPMTPPSDNMLRLKVTYPAGGTLPASFDGEALGPMRECVQSAAEACKAAIIDLNHDGVPEVVVLKDNTVTIFVNAGGKWNIEASDETYLDKDEVKAFQAGQVGAQPHSWSDLTVGQRNITIR